MNIEKIKNKIVNLKETDILKIIIYVLLGLIVAFLIFQAGISVGFHRASFARNWSENYYENFSPRFLKDKPIPKMIGSMGDRFPNANGANGKIIQIDLPTLIVRDIDNIEKVILINNDTEIISQRQKILSENLKVNDFIVVIGSPNDQGQIEAKLIRLMPAPPDSLNRLNR